VFDDERRFEVGQGQKLRTLEGVGKPFTPKLRPFASWRPYSSVSSRPHAGWRRCSSNVEIPSVNHRGTRYFESCSVKDVRHLVPERRLPAEFAGRVSLGRVHGHDTSEARAQRADEAGQPERAHGEIVVHREHFDQDRACGFETVARDKRLVRFCAERERVRPQHGGFVFRQLEHEIAGVDHVELRERVEQSAGSS
jgi:hypothetical protein